MINVFQPCLGEEEVSALRNVIESNWLGKGKLTEEFESKFANHLSVDAKNIKTTNCCSEGLFISMDAFGIGAGDEVILPTTSFVGSANAIMHHGANISFCDVDRRTLNVTAADIEKRITKKTKAVLLLHYGGVPCEMDEIMEMADSYGIKVIEDAACGIYSTYKGRALGTIGDMGMWSFDAMKILVSGDGAALYFKDQEIAEKMAKYMYFGLESKSGFSNSVDSKWWEFEVSSLGHRAIMNDMTASVALEQLKKLPSFIDRRSHIADMYNDLLKDEEWILLPPEAPEYDRLTHYFYHIQVDNDLRDELASYLRKNDIYTTYRYYPLHWVKYYGHSEEVYPEAEWAALHTLCLPIHQSLKNEEVVYIVEMIKKFGKEHNC